jgi:hypothetical protein
MLPRFQNGCRHQFRVVVFHDRVLRVCEQGQADPDAPCNESRGAVTTTVPVDDFPPEFCLAVRSGRTRTQTRRPPSVPTWPSRHDL